jgi:hypothetical protein
LTIGSRAKMGGRLGKCYWRGYIQGQLRQDAATDGVREVGDAEQTERWLGFMKEHRLDAPRTYEDALLRMNDAEAAAKWLIEQLESQDLRSSALLSIQQYAVPIETARQTELRRRRSELMARADVQTEIEKVGRIESYKIEVLGQ